MLADGVRSQESAGYPIGIGSLVDEECIRISGAGGRYVQAEGSILSELRDAVVER